MLDAMNAALLFVIPGRAESANPESRNKQFRHHTHLDSGSASFARVPE
jgi:hypothetical protein